MSVYEPYDDSTAPVGPTNRQVALLAAAKIYEGAKSENFVLTTARQFLKFLEEG